VRVRVDCMAAASVGVSRGTRHGIRAHGCGFREMLRYRSGSDAMSPVYEQSQLFRVVIRGEGVVGWRCVAELHGGDCKPSSSCGGRITRAMSH
jgi:hypothetical protein